MKSKWQKSPQVSKTLLDILANLNSAVVSTVLILPPISNSTSLFLDFWKPF